jgi:hypothetical protein
MIDTDKYEGHTEGPWEWFEGEGHKDLQSNMAFLMFGEVGKSQYPKPADAALIADAPLLLAEVKRLREDNHVLRMIDWEYERVWEWLMENADYTCRKLLLLIEEWKEEDGLVTIGGMTYEKEMVE